MAHIDVLTLGRLAVVVNGVETAGATAQPVRTALLVYLAVERSVTRDAAIGCIWPEHPTDRARHTLSQTVYQLRRDLGDGWLESDGSYLRCTDRVRCDTVEFARLVDAGAREEALALYRGPFLESCYLVDSVGFEQWRDRHEARLAFLHRRACAARIEALRTEGRMDEAISVARGWLELAPLEGEPRQRLIRLFVESGKRGAALREFNAYSRLLEREGLEPLPEVVALAREIREREVVGGRRPLYTTAPRVAEPVTDPSVEIEGPARSVKIPRLALVMLGAAALTLVTSRAIRNRGGAPTTGRSGVASIAVLPFESAGDEAAEDYFVDGIHEGFIENLVRRIDLRVMSSGSVARFRHSRDPASEIARTLGVDAVIRGSIRRSGDSLWLRTDLIDLADRVVGTAAASGMVAETPELLRQLAIATASGMGEVARTSDADVGEPLPPVDRAAYETYLQAEQSIRDLQYARLPEATEFYEAAIAADSSFASPYAGAALSEFLSGLFGVLPRSQAWPRARSWAERALERDGSLARAHTVLGLVRLYDDWDWQVAETELLEALRLDRNDVLARHGYADLLTLRGEVDEGLRQIQLARSVDPLSPLTDGPLAGHLLYARRFEDVVAEVRRMRERFGRPRFAGSFLADALWQLQRYDAALAEFRQTFEWDGNPELERAIEQAYAEAGPAAAMRAVADHDARRWEAGDGSALEIARWYV